MIRWWRRNKARRLVARIAGIRATLKAAEGQYLYERSTLQQELTHRLGQLVEVEVLLSRVPVAKVVDSG